MKTITLYDGICPGPCNNRWRTAHTAYENALTHWQHTPDRDRGDRPDPPTTLPRAGNPIWDPGCARIIRTALAELDDLASQAAATADGHRPGADRSQKTTTTKSTPSPSPIVDTLDELYGALVEVEDQWRAANNYQARPARPRNGHARRLSIAFLLDELDAILAHPGSVAFGVAALSWQRRLRALTSSDPTAKRSPIRCPRCSERQVGRTDHGTYEYECKACGRLLSQDEHDREYAEQADEHQQQEVGA